MYPRITHSAFRFVFVDAHGSSLWVYTERTTACGNEYEDGGALRHTTAVEDRCIRRRCEGLEGGMRGPRRIEGRTRREMHLPSNSRSAKLFIFVHRVGTVSYSMTAEIRKFAKGVQSDAPGSARSRERTPQASDMVARDYRVHPRPSRMRA